MSFQPHISTEELLIDNPVHLEQVSEGEYDFAGYYSYEYDVTLHQRDLWIGTTTILFYIDGHKELYEPTLNETFRGNGFGTALYIAAAGINIPDLDGPHQLQSDHLSALSDGSRNVWESLVRRRLATPPDNNSRYTFVHNLLEHVIDEAHDGKMRLGELDGAKL